MKVVTVGHADAKRALQLPMNDLEDAFQAAASLAWGADYILSRNVADYKNSPVPALTPKAFIKTFAL